MYNSDVYKMDKGFDMQRTQIYFEQQTLKELKSIASSLNISVSEFIRSVVKKEIKKKKQDDLQSFISKMTPVKSFLDVDAKEYVNDIRFKSRILND